MRYDAFISYRHSELDMEIAKKLHKGLETFKIPASVRKKYGKKKIERVFRDQEELPIGSDLDDNITAALKDSEYLIVICSPRTPKSVWVCKEIETFIKLHDRSHALAILIEGEPNESFPAALLTDENGKPVEPLAADIRGETKKERDKKFKTELMRLCAPLIGCEYDDLKQRHRERIIRRNICIAAIAAVATAALGVAFGLYNAVVARNMEALAKKNADLALEKTVMAGQIFDQYQETQKNQSRFYAEKSLSLLEEGNREAAILTAIAGLPDGGHDDRPYVPENEFALSQALHVYDDGSVIDHDRLLHHDNIVTDIEYCADGKYLLTVDRNENVYVWDTENWERKVMIPYVMDDKGYLETVEGASADESGVYIATTASLTKYDFNGAVLFSYEGDSDYLGFELCEDKSIAVLIGTQKIDFVDMQGGKLLFSKENGDGASYSARGAYIGEGVYAATHVSADDSRTILTLIDTETWESTETEIRHDYVLKLAGSKEGYAVVLSCNPDFYYGAGVTELGLERINKDGSKSWSEDLNIQIINTATFNTQLKVQDYNKKVVFAVENGAYIYDAEDGTESGRLAMFGEVETMLLSTNSSVGCVGYSNGVMDWIDTDKIMLYDDYRLDTGISLRDMYFFGNERVIMSRSSDIYVLSYHKGEGLEELPELDKRYLATAISPSGSYYMMNDYMDGKSYSFYDKDGEQLYVFDQSNNYAFDICCQDDKTLLATSEGIWEIDPYKATATLNTYKTLGSDNIYSRGEFTRDGNFCVVWNITKLAAFNMKDQSLVYEQDCEEMTGCAEISEDGTKILISSTGKNLSIIDTASGKTREYEDVNLRETANSYTSDYLAVNPSGTTAAMFCADGKVRIINTEDGKLVASLPMQINLSSFILFDKQGKHLIMQGDDHTVYIWDINKGEYSSIITAYSDLKYITTDDKDGMIICCEGTGIHVLEDNTFARIAYVPDGIAYIADENAFIQRDGTNVYKNYYMDYKQLIEEAKRQFPDAKLGAKEKKELNIE